MELLENALSLRTSAHAGVAIPRIFKHLGSKTKLFPFNRGGCHTSDIGHWFAATHFSNSPIFLSISTSQYPSCRSTTVPSTAFRVSMGRYS